VQRVEDGVDVERFEGTGFGERTGLVADLGALVVTIEVETCVGDERW
jgi:hypothetical protein